MSKKERPWSQKNPILPIEKTPLKIEGSNRSSWRITIKKGKTSSTRRCAMVTLVSNPPAPTSPARPSYLPLTVYTGKPLRQKQSEKVLKLTKILKKWGGTKLSFSSSKRTAVLTKSQSSMISTAKSIRKTPLIQSKAYQILGNPSPY